MRAFPHSFKSDSAKTLEKKEIQSGFTLIELISVMVILSIISLIGVGFVVNTTESYQRTQTRALIANTARQALERMTRQLRGALPYSVRITNAGQCVQFMPILQGGHYVDPVPDQQNNAAGVNSIAASPVPANITNTHYLAIGAMNAAEIYGASPGSLAGYAGYLNGNLRLSAAKQWRRNSINKRFYILDRAQAFCLVGNELRFYSDINPQDSAVTLTAASDILARNLAIPPNAAPFSLANGSENSNALVTIALDFSSGGETVNYTQGVFVRNVP
jgi:MSHA biogenesis protein MshO